MKFRITKTSGQPVNEFKNLIQDENRDRHLGYVYLEIKTLKELLEIIEKVGRVVIHEDDTIEIYDDYRE